MQVKKVLRSIQVNFPRQQELIARYREKILKYFKIPHEKAFGAIKLFDLSVSKVFVDIGSNRGQSINSMLLFANEVKIIAFEANPELSVRLKKKYEQTDNVQVFNYGLSCENCKLKLHIPFYKNWMFDGLASFNDSAPKEWLKQHLFFFREDHLRTKSVDCELRRLDDFEICPYFIKIDVENYETEVLKGATETISKHRPIILIESLNEESVHLINRLGYHFFTFDKGCFVECEPQYNTFCLHAEEHKELIKKIEN